MKIIFLLLSIICIGTLARGQYTLISYSSSTSGVLTTTTNIGATLCVVGVPGFDAGGTISIADGQSNTWLLADSGGVSGGTNGVIFYTYYKGSIGTPIGTSASYTPTVTCSACFPSSYLACYSGGTVSSDPLYAHAHNLGGISSANNAGGTNQAGSCGALNNYLAVSLCNCNTGVSAPALSINLGFNLFASNTYFATHYFCGGLAVKIITGTSNPAWQVPGVTGGGTAISAVFKSTYTNPPNIGPLLQGWNNNRK